jgi:hypothetical protein
VDCVLQADSPVGATSVGPALLIKVKDRSGLTERGPMA